VLGTTHDYDLLIREQHLDTFGHVNNAAYLQILEDARWDLITRNGYGLDEVHRRKVGPTILELRLRFRRELRNRQRVTIRSWVESYSGKVGRFEQHILDEEGNVCCEATFTIGLFDLAARKLIPPTPEWRAALGLPPSREEGEPPLGPDPARPREA
jgi:acyl-CoA thioester hydrolase